MSDSKITASHLRRTAFVYVRQSTQAQVEFNRESTERQYRLVERAAEFGWHRDQIRVVDGDLGVSGGGLVERSGFAFMTAEVGLGHAGIVLGLEVSRLARNNAEWYRLLDLCGVTDTLIGDADGIYHPGLFNDRLVLGLKGTMSEAELHVLRARLLGGIRNKAERGELRRSLPVGYVYGELDGQVLFHPDEAVVGAVRAVFERFEEMGSARRVWKWFRSEGLLFPSQAHSTTEMRWIVPNYGKIHRVLTNPVYAGAYVYGKSRQERYVDESGRVRKRVRKLPRSEWSIVIHDHHEGFVDWPTFEAIQTRLASNTRPRPHSAGGAVREGAALLQGIASCGRCGRSLYVHYSGRTHSPGYHCPGQELVEGRASWCLRIGAGRIHDAVASAFLEALAPAGVEAALRAAELLETEYDAALEQWQLQVERARYEAGLAQRRYRSVDPDNRLVARGLEAEWEASLRAVREAEAELARRAQQRPLELTADERARIQALGADLRQVWGASVTTDRDRKELLRTLLEEVIISVDREAEQAHLTLRWRGGQLDDFDIAVPRPKPKPLRTDEETVALVRRLANHYPDSVIAGILNRQGRRTAYDLEFTANRVNSLRRHWQIPRFERAAEPKDGELLSLRKAADALGLSPSTLSATSTTGSSPASS